MGKDPVLGVGYIYQKYHQHLFQVCQFYLRSEPDAYDAMMDILEKLLHKQMDHQIVQIKNWLTIVAKNHCLNTIKQSRVTYHEALPEQVIATFQEYFENDTPWYYGLKMKLSTVLKELPSKQRVCLELFYFEQRSYAEIAHETGYDLKAVKSYLQNGKRNLKNKLLIP